ncbi:enhancing lycopene biosynthesis protein 2 [Candidatus Photodesmus blepharus]|uniref:Glyoxalase n=1 Tax=Candidatus Photodesmus blepharonis TaxID=1179155 RepID=A0A084CND6_9GAMM|nr:isoprenoid biosynthesis glyoxalase ElbB [Candidatus Photodesmus blepharus]KEY91315.1 enhancing lycopene biosynthesis protein 2 [Candidatus Photodesmus blepharus]
MSKKFKNAAVVLSGCGVFDGSEINEVVFTLLELERNLINYSVFAPDIYQYDVINHITGEKMKEKRNVLIESGRITRGKVKSFSELNPNEFDALVVPGGFGVAKNLSTFALEGPYCSINDEFANIMRAFNELSKPAAYMCIAPALLPKIFAGIKLTIGNDQFTADAIKTCGGEHITCSVDGIVKDHVYKIITTPAYMLAKNCLEAHHGISLLIKELKKEM